MTHYKTFLYQLSETLLHMWDAIYSIVEEKDADELRII